MLCLVIGVIVQVSQRSRCCDLYKTLGDVTMSAWCNILEDVNFNVPHDHCGSVNSETCCLDGLTREADSMLLSEKAEDRILRRKVS